MSYTLIKTGAQIDDILVRAQTGGEIDQDLALKAPLASPALTGTPTAPTPAEGDSSTKIATTEFVAAATAGAITDTAGPSDVVTIPDGSDADMLSFKASIEPLQDLHGYANPWPVGGGKNILPLTLANLKANTQSGSWTGDTYSHAGVAWTFEVNEEGAVTKITANGLAGSQSILILNFTIPAGTYKGSALTTSGSYATFHANFGGTNILSIGGENVTFSEETATVFRCYVDSGYTANNLAFYPMVRLSSVADATFAPYSNICPISGWTGASGVVEGLNLADESTIKRTDFNGSANNNWIHFDQLIRCENGQQFSFSSNFGLTTVYSFQVKVYDAQKTHIGYMTPIYYVNPTAIKFTVNFTGAKFIEIGFYHSQSLASYTMTNAMLVYGDDYATYSPYDGTTYPIDWTDEAGTVYGGTLNVTTGVLTVTHASVTLENETATEMSQFYTGANYNTIEYVPMRTLGMPDADYLSDAFETVQALTAPYQIVKGTSPTATRCYLSVPTDYATRDAAIALINTIEPQIVYELATPQTYQLDPVAVRSLLGVNNCWADTGETEIEYKADLKLYIDKKIAEAI